MLRYVLRRILLAVPTLLVISMAVFGLSKCAPYERALDLGEGTYGDLRQQETAIRLKAERLGLDKPAFYFALTTAAFPDTLHKIFPPSRREFLKKLCAQTGSWSAVARYETAIREVYFFSEELPDSLVGAADFRLAASDLMKNEQVEKANGLCEQIQKTSTNLPPDSRSPRLLDSLQNAISTLREEARPGNMNIPAFHWHGLDNQYHRWLSGFATGDWGMSWYWHKPVWEALRFSFFSTMIINGLAIFLTYLIAVPLGVAMARRRERAFDRMARWVLLMLHAMPVFWLGSLLILLFATPDFGFFLINGIVLESFQGSGKSFAGWCVSNFDKFILPILSLSLYALAMLALQMRGGVLDSIGQDFIRTARAKGVRENAVFWRHAFRNALFPLITVFASLFPLIFTGALTLEYLFQFPGLGMKTHEAFMKQDYPVLFAILMLAAALTVLGNLIADLLYVWADPRVRFSK
jgi:peptide/nickel transport system permease protein